MSRHPSFQELQQRNKEDMERWGITNDGKTNFQRLREQRERNGGYTDFGLKLKQGFETGFNWTKDRLSELWKGLTGQTSAEATKEANERNIANQNYWNEIQMQREDTAHQREMADLQAAGLNPWLSVGGGAQSTALGTAQAEPVDGSKMLQATTAAALLAIVKLLGRNTTRTASNTNVTYLFKR